MADSAGHDTAAWQRPCDRLARAVGPR